MKYILVSFLLLALALSAECQILLSNITVYDRLEAGGTPLNGIGGIILTTDIDDTTEIFFVEAEIDVERIGAAQNGLRTDTVGLAAGIWSSGEFFFAGEFGEWATEQGSYATATNKVTANIPAAPGHTIVRISVAFPREQYLSEGDYLIGLFPFAEESPQDPATQLKARIRKTDQPVSTDLVRSFQVAGFPLEQGPSFNAAPSARVVIRRLHYSSAKPALNIRVLTEDSEPKVRISWPTGFPGWALQYDVDPLFSGPESLSAQTTRQIVNRLNIQPATPESDVYYADISNDSVPAFRCFRLLWPEDNIYLPEFLEVKSAFGGPPIVPLPEP